MTEQVTITVDGTEVRVEAGTTVAAALGLAGTTSFRRSVRGEPRGPLCGMGLCAECRVTINGAAHCRSCLVLCEAGMEVDTDA